MRTEEIVSILERLIPRRHNFLGVFAADEIPRVTSFPSCCVLNTDPARLPGTHWVAAYYYSRRSVEFFDSYGMHPIAYKLLFHPTNWNRIPLQSIRSSLCGQYCIYYLYHRARGYSLNRIVHDFSPSQPLANDRKVYRWFRSHAPRPLPRRCTNSQKCRAKCNSHRK